MHIVNIWDHKIGSGEPPFFVAELGICHGGSVDVALELARLAVEAGAHCIKTETFQREALVFDPSAEVSYTIKGKRYTEPLAEHMAKYELSFDEHLKIKKVCDELKVPFISTAHDFKAIDFLVDIGSAGIKIASPDIIHYPLLDYAAKKNLPIIMDTGGAYQYEVEMAVQRLRQGGCMDIIVNHNPAGHPAPAENNDLNIIPRLQSILEIPVGISDHYEGYEMCYAAVVIGANLIEKPISMDNTVPEPERNWSISIDDLPIVIKQIQSSYLALGKSERVLNPETRSYRDRNRVACAASKDLKVGDNITFENIVFGRPRKGIGVEHWDLIVGRKLRHPKKRLEFIQWEDLE